MEEIARKITIGDLHRRDWWKQYKPYLFLGDYWDSFSIPFQQQYNNFMDIISYKLNNPEIILLLGKHDYHYLSIGEQYSGYQKHHAYEIEIILKKYLHLFQIAHEEVISGQNYIFSNAGLSKTWMKNNNCNSIDDVNELFKHKPKSFHFAGRDPYGDNITQGPMWIRPDSLLKDMWGNGDQVVGHAIQNEIVKRQGENNLLYVIDNREKKSLTILL